ncbi:MAG: glycerol-3-phosphate transporter, partial [Burkholderiales bacterium]
MIENRPLLDVTSHLVLILGALVVAFPLYIAFVASTLPYEQIVSV